MSLLPRFTYISILFFLISINLTHAQSDSVKYDIDFKFNDGIFINFNQVRYNNAIPFKNIITSKNYQDPNFVKEILSQKSLKVFVNGEKKEISNNTIWGYAQNGVLYIHHQNYFYRVPSVGKISFFVANIEVRHQTNIDPWSNSYYGAQNQSYSSTELHNFLLDFNTGTLYNYSVKSIEHLISSNEELHKEFTDLKKRKQKQMAFIYIRRFNESSPLYFPK